MFINKLELKNNETLDSQNFSLLDSMSATELGDAKMD